MITKMQHREAQICPDSWVTAVEISARKNAKLTRPSVARDVPEAHVAVIDANRLFGD